MVGTGWNIDLSGKAIIVTGGNRGIGLAISRQVAQAGGHVAVVYHSSENAPDEAEKIAEEFNVKTKAYQVDTSDAKAMHELVHKVYADLGPVGGLVANAGVGVSKPALEMTHDDFLQQFDTNFWGVFAASQACAALWKEHGYQNGRIVFVSSMSAHIANKDATQCFYNPSKAAVSMLAKCLAMEWRDLGITVNTICPGYVETDMTAGITEDKEKYEAKMKDEVPLARISKPDEQAGMAVFLLSDRASYLTGSDHLIDGGCTLW
ncbi:hypothetical protein NCC49_001267 [Naganishia albida]|nr:hypothetical protein NCC49_001267 [Naganishia albida]